LRAELPAPQLLSIRIPGLLAHRFPRTLFAGASARAPAGHPGAQPLRWSHPGGSTSRSVRGLAAHRRFGGSYRKAYGVLEPPETSRSLLLGERRHARRSEERRVGKEWRSRWSP